MKNQITEYQNELYIRAAAAAFVRDSIRTKYQLHWHFAGKCEALAHGKDLTLEEVLEKQSEASVLVEQHLNDDAWQNWCLAYGRIDGFAEVIAATQLLLAGATESAPPEVKLVKLASKAGASEFVRALAKEFALAHRCASAFSEDRPLRWYFEAKAKALRDAHSKSVEQLAEEFETARFRVHREASNWKERQVQRGLAAGFAEATALAKLTNAPRKAARA